MVRKLARSTLPNTSFIIPSKSNVGVRVPRRGTYDERVRGFFGKGTFSVKSLKLCLLILFALTLPAFSESSAVRMFSLGFSDNQDVVPDKNMGLASVQLFFSEPVTLGVGDFRLSLNGRSLSLTDSTISSVGTSSKIFTFKFPYGRTSSKGIYCLNYKVAQNICWGNGANKVLGAKPPTNAVY